MAWTGARKTTNALCPCSIRVGFRHATMSIKDFSLVDRQAPMDSVGWPQSQLLKRKSMNLMISIDCGLLRV